MPSTDLQWWLDRLENVRPISNGYVAKCPGHDDRVQSFSITERDGKILFYCFAGCEYNHIIDSIEGRTTAPRPETTKTVPISFSSKVDTRTSGDWWQEYTCIPVDLWEGIGVKFDKQGVRFTWSSSTVCKIRKIDSKEFFWVGSPIPPLWPDLPQEMPEEIYLTEGESDCGTLRNIGLPAWSITRGAKSGIPVSVWRMLKQRGVKKIRVAFDEDTPGQTGADRLSQEIAGEGIECQSLAVVEIIDPLLGEKDLLDIWRRVRQPDVFRELIDLIALPPEAFESRRLSLDEILRKPIPEEDWLVDGVWTEGSVGLIIGSPKMGKSLLALDLALSVASGSPFLDEFAVPRPGPVVIVSKEDTEAALQARLRKIAEHKGLIPKSVEMFERPRKPGKEHRPNFRLRLSVGSTLPVFLDLSQDFVFDHVRTQHLLGWLDEIQQTRGQIALIIIDPILKSLPDGIDEYKASQVNSAVFRSAETLRDETGAAVSLIHHRGKGNPDGRDSLGSIAFFASSESTLFIGGNQRKSGEFIPVEGVYK